MTGTSLPFFFGDALFNGGNLITVNGDSISGSGLQVNFEVYNTGNSVYYFIEWVSITPLVDHKSMLFREAPGANIWTNPAGNRFNIILDLVPVSAPATMPVARKLIIE